MNILERKYLTEHKKRPTDTEYNQKYKKFFDSLPTKKELEISFFGKPLKEFPEYQHIIECTVITE